MLKKNYQLHIVGFILFFLLGHQAWAQSYQLNGDYYVRSSPDFLSSTNKIGVLNQGSTFRVINRSPIGRNAEALEIQVIARVGGYLQSSPTDKYYIYKPRKSSDFTARDGESNDGAGVAQCKTCQENKNVNTAIAINKISDTVYEIANTAPKSKEPIESSPARFQGALQSGSLDAQIKAYSERKEVDRMITWAMKNKNRASKGKCYRKVKEAIATQCGPRIAGLRCSNVFSPEGGKNGPGNNLTKSVSTELPDAYALSAKTRLKEQGFVNLLDAEPYKSQMRSPSDAPKGAILVYSSGTPCTVAGKRIADCGHAEIKVGNAGEPGYVSDYYSADAINETGRAQLYGPKYKLVGVMIKPKE